MNNNNYIFYAIIIYITTIILFIIIKPDIIYDHKNKKYKEFGYTKDKTMFPITIVAVFLAVSIIVLLSFFYEEEKPNSQQIQYITNPQYMQGGGIPPVVPYHHYHSVPQIQPVQPIQHVVHPMQPIVYQQPQTQIQPPQSQQVPVNIQIPSGGKTTVLSEKLNPKIKYKLVPIGSAESTSSADK